LAAINNGKLKPSTKGEYVMLKEHVVETVEIESRTSGTSDTDKQINKYLKLGWILIADWIVDYGDPRHRIETAHFLLGWIDRSRKPEYPQE